MQPFRFAVQVSKSTTPQGWRDLARKIEDLGYSTLYVPDHFDDQLGPVVALTVAAESTSQLRVGSLVFGNDYRHPVVHAKEIASLAWLSGGRVEFGLGAGWMSSDYRASGIAEDRPGVRVSRMEEALHIYKALWREGRATFDGEYYQVADAVSTPVLDVTPPIVIGGGSPRVLGIAAREADIVGVNPNLAAGYIGAEVIESAQASYFDERIGWIKDAAGNRFSDLELQILTFFVTITNDSQSTLDGLAAMMGVSADMVAETPVALVGSELSLIHI